MTIRQQSSNYIVTVRQLWGDYLGLCESVTYTVVVCDTSNNHRKNVIFFPIRSYGGIEILYPRKCVVGWKFNLRNSLGAPLDARWHQRCGGIMPCIARSPAGCAVTRAMRGNKAMHRSIVPLDARWHERCGGIRPCISLEPRWIRSDTSDAGEYGPARWSDFRENISADPLHKQDRYLTLEAEYFPK